MFYTTPKATEALIITGGFGKSNPESPFRVVVGKGAFWIPIIHTITRMYIGAYDVKFKLKAQTKQNIDLNIQANVVFRVGQTDADIKAAARRFANTSREEIVDIAEEIFAGETRSLVGGLSAEEIISERMTLAADVVAGVQSKMTSLGWSVDSFVISDVSDNNGHIEALSRPELVRVQKEAAIAEARSNSAVEDEKQKTQREISLFQKETDIQVSQNTIETAEARARAKESGPQAEAKARLEVVEAQTELAQAQAAQREAELKAEKITENKAEAEAKMIQAQAEADAIKLRAEALASNGGIYIDAQIVEQLPALMESFATGLTDANLTVLGDNDAVTGLATQFAHLVPTLRSIAQGGHQSTNLNDEQNA